MTYLPTPNPDVMRCNISLGLPTSVKVYTVYTVYTGVCIYTIFAIFGVYTVFVYTVFLGVYTVFFREDFSKLCLDVQKWTENEWKLL